MEIEPILINLDEYTRCGEGANGESYNHNTDSSLMLKMGSETYPIHLILSDLERSKAAYDAGIPSPKPGEYVTDGHGRFGIRFERIPNKISYARAIGNHPEKVEQYARDFARQCLKLHSIHLDTSKFSSVKDDYLTMLEQDPYFSEDEKIKLAEYIRNSPDADTVVHGDLQFGNAIMSDEKRYFIDLGDVSYGSPLFDLGMVLLTCRYEDPDFLKMDFHMDVPTAAQFWTYFCKEYFGEDCDPEEMDRRIRPYAGLKVLIIERNTKMYFPVYHELLSEITNQ